eukprot:CAMPEP_0197434506 /NCGR_PEP_ID=MMETSP1175-20131217/2218_1 /TAXON_ID=1003142 /ORGANISM="Triceratium dubium, Strain CCMP147" /LENGTH=202 /DNA_ID=CAMNT_0042963251 /DNA_START=136 /DNA_END=744 /DNA_ORIENTATION=+
MIAQAKSSSLVALSTKPLRSRTNASEFLEQRQWNRVRGMLRIVEDDTTAPSEEYRHNFDDSDNSGHTFLHELCASHPPVDVVRSTICQFPDMVTAQDGESRTPLHVAIVSKAPLDVITCLLQSDPKGTEFRDSNGKTPLMMACEGMLTPRVSSPHGDHNVELKWFVEVIKLLATASSNFILHEVGNEIPHFKAMCQIYCKKN